MPSKLPRPCKHPGCPGLTTDRSGYCDKHKGNYNKQYSQSRPDVKEQSFYRSKQWTQTSKEYRQAHPLCECGCGKPSRMVHHVPELPVLLRRGDNPCDWRYLKALSWGCHEKTKKSW